MFGKIVFVVMLASLRAHAAYVPPLAVQPVSQSDATQLNATVVQGATPWDENITQIAGSALSASNALPARITNGTSYIDPTLIRALTSADVVSAVQSGTWTVAVSNAILPTGAATDTLQTAGNTTLTAISGQLPSILGANTVANSLVVNIASDQTVPVSAASLPLPAGAATSANQATEITSLGSIDTKTPALVAGRVPVDGSGVTQPVSIAAAVAVTGPLNVTAAYAEITTLTTTAQTFTAPANAVGFVLEYPSLSTNTDNIRWKMGAAATISSGMRMEPGRDSGFIPGGSDVSVIAETASSQTVTIQWVTQ